MGLDMYLYAKNYLSSFDEKEKEKAEQIAALFPELTHMKDHFDDCPVRYVTIEVGYWRKANAIHDWFVQNVQDGEDKCKPHYVSREDLQSLRLLCQQVLANPSLANDLLPTTSGFFFGSTEYDEWYMDGLKHTIEVIDNALKMPIDWDFEYRSSW